MGAANSAPAPARLAPESCFDVMRASAADVVALADAAIGAYALLRSEGLALPEVTLCELQGEGGAPCSCGITLTWHGRTAALRAPYVLQVVRPETLPPSEFTTAAALANQVRELAIAEMTPAERGI